MNHFLLCLIYITRIVHISLPIKCSPGVKNVSIQYSRGNPLSLLTDCLGLFTCLRIGFRTWDLSLKGFPNEILHINFIHESDLELCVNGINQRIFYVLCDIFWILRIKSTEFGQICSQEMWIWWCHHRNRHITFIIKLMCWDYKILDRALSKLE